MLEETNRMILKTHENVTDMIKAMEKAEDPNTAHTFYHTAIVMLENLKHALNWLSDINEIEDVEWKSEQSLVDERIERIERVYKRIWKRTWK